MNLRQQKATFSAYSNTEFTLSPNYKLTFKLLNEDEKVKLKKNKYPPPPQPEVWTRIGTSALSLSLSLSLSLNVYENKERTFLFHCFKGKYFYNPLFWPEFF